MCFADPPSLLHQSKLYFFFSAPYQLTCTSQLLLHTITKQKQKRSHHPLSSWTAPNHITSLHPIPTIRNEVKRTLKKDPVLQQHTSFSLSGAQSGMGKPFASASASARVSGFSHLSDDVVLKIFRKLEQDPRDWSRLACVCSRFSGLVRSACWKAQCYLCIPSLVSSLLAARFGDKAPEEPPGGWASLYKLSVCCPGLLHAGVLMENSDFGLEREIGPDVSYHPLAESPPSPSPLPVSNLATSAEGNFTSAVTNAADTPNCEWSLYDDLYTDTMYDISECSHYQDPIDTETPDSIVTDLPPAEDQLKASNWTCRFSNAALTGVHLAADPWSLIQEQGNKFLAPRFRSDTLYISERPGCVHVGQGGEGLREYMLFRGMFLDFKRSGVWRAILAGGGDGTRRGRVDVGCAFCPCRETWDLQSSFCLGRVASGYHDDGEPVVRAFVCENGHVAGAWTEPPNRA